MVLLVPYILIIECMIITRSIIHCVWSEDEDNALFALAMKNDDVDGFVDAENVYSFELGLSYVKLL